MGENDSEEVKEIGQKFGGRAAYSDEIAGLVASICNQGLPPAVKLGTRPATGMTAI